MVSQLAPHQQQASPALLARLNGLRPHLAYAIKGQAHVTERVSAALIRGELGTTHPKRPKGSWLFVGPTGVGKTETAKVFTAYLFNGAKPVCFDMSEYQLQKSVEKLIGESREDSGLFGRALRGITRGTLLFDEIEKAHPLVLDLFLQVLDEGCVTLATGERLNLSGFYIVCTSNIGSSDSIRMETAPFASIERTVVMRVREQLRPELVGRANDIIVFSRLDYLTQRAICEEMITTELNRLAELGHVLKSNPEVVEYLVRAGYHRTLGARPMRSAVERTLQDVVTSNLLIGKPSSGQLAVSSSKLSLEILD